MSIYCKYLVFMLFAIIINSCGEINRQDVGNEVGSIVFNVDWQGSPDNTAPSSTATRIMTAALDCAATGVSDVQATVYDSSNNIIATGGPWSCSAHSGSIANVPAGSNRKVVVLGKDSSANVIYRGELSGISVTSGQATSAGTISAIVFIPALSAPTNSSTVEDGSFSLQWSSVQGAASYQIQISTDSSFTNNISDTTAVSATYSPSTLTKGITYYWRVKATDVNGNASKWSDVWSFSVSNTGTAPSSPTGVSATAGDGQTSIGWSSVSGATSYNIYWSTASGVTKTTGTKITGATSPYTHTGLANGTIYYYVVTAANAYGESAESSQASAMPASGPPPSAPTGVTVAAGNGQTSISWTAFSGATSYNIYWSTASGVTKTTGTKITGATSPYTHTGLTNGTTYYYVVTAVSSNGESSESTEKSAVTMIYDDFSAFSGWTYDTLVSSSGAGFYSDGSYLLVNSWGSGTYPVGPVVYKDLSPSIDLLNDTFTIDFYLIAQINDGWYDQCAVYIEFLDSDNTSIIKAAYQGTNDPYFWINILGVESWSGNLSQSLSGKVSLTASSGAYKLLYNGVQQATNSLTTQRQATKLRLGAVNTYSPVPCEGTEIKLDWLRLTKP